jgi:hypothetical protein
MITLERLGSCTGNINRYFAWLAGVGEGNPNLDKETWNAVGRQAAAFVDQLAMLHDSRDFRLSFGPITFFGNMVPADVLGTENAEYRAGFKMNGRRFIVNGWTFQELP